MEGPYRDLGSGFARLTGAEGARRSPSRISSVEDALLEMLHNARDAGATNIHVASVLRNRRYRTLTVIDDGHGIPERYAELIFEPGVTSRHLDPTNPTTNPGAGLSLYHIKNIALTTRIASTRNPTAITATFDTHTLPERALQSRSRPSRSNLHATLENFLQENPSTTPPNLYHGSPPAILATLLNNRIIHMNITSSIRNSALSLGLEVSLRTVQRVLRGGVVPAGRVVVGEDESGVGSIEEVSREVGGSGPLVELGRDEIAEVAAILGRAARAGYAELLDLEVLSRPGEISVKALIYSPEEEYE